MPLITSIPTELIHEILSHIQLEDLENFAQISRRIYTIAGPVLSEHRALCRENRIFTSDHAPLCLKAKLNYLRRVQEDPRIGRYVRTIKVLGLHDIGYHSYFLYPRLTEEDLHLIGQLAGEIGLFNLLLGVGDTWSVPSSKWPYIARAFAEPILLTLLLVRFPNTTSIEIEPGSANFCWTIVFRGLLKAMTSHLLPALERASRLDLRPLIIYSHSISDIGDSCALPSVTLCSAPYLSRGWRCANGELVNSTITDLELWKCAVSPRYLFEFLRGFTTLRSFKYSFAFSAMMAPANRFDPFMIRRGLASHSATTLQKIVLLAHPDDFAPSFMGSLRKFSALTELRTTYNCLIEEDCRHHLLGLDLPGSLRRLVLDGQKRSMSNAQTSPCSCDPVAAVVEAAVHAKTGRYTARIIPIEELVFTGYKGFANERDKKCGLKMAKDVSLAVGFSAIEELDSYPPQARIDLS